MAGTDYTKWLAFGSGVGIEIGPRDLTVTLVRVRPGGARVVGSTAIERFAERPAAEWGAEYAAFLKQHGVAYLAAAVLLPRHEVIVRQLSMPGVAEKDLEQAVRFQIDGLHPYSEEDAVYDYARIGRSDAVLVGIARKDAIDRYIALFAEAGVKMAAFTFSAAVLYGSLRLFGRTPEPGFLITDEADGLMEAYGESEARPIFSASFETSNERIAERARGLALSELRLPPDTVPHAVHNTLPPPVAAPEGFSLDLAPMTYATALAGACPRLYPKANLLPPDLRVTSSRAMYIPSIALASLLLLGAGGLALYGSWEDKKFLRSLQAEVARLEPAARRPMAIDREIAVARQRTQLLDGFRKRTQADLDVVNELTKQVAPPGWLMSLEVTRDQVRLSGETPQASGLVRGLDQSPFFEGTDYALPLARSGTGEAFSLRTRRKGMVP
jgi:hypothetical protein